MRYERPIFIAGILPSCSSLYPVLVLIRRASHICSMLEKNPQFFFSPPQKKYRPLSCLLHLCKLHKTTTCFFCKM